MARASCEALSLMVGEIAVESQLLFMVEPDTRVPDSSRQRTAHALPSPCQWAEV